MNSISKHPGRAAIAVGCALMMACGPFNIAVTIPNAKINVNTPDDVSNVPPERAVALVANVTNVYLIEPNETPPAEHVNDAGHIQVYFDNYDGPPLVITAKTNITVTVPAGTKAGGHKFLCRVHKHDGTPTTTTVEVSINVTVTVGGGGDAGVTVTDAG